MKGRFWKRFGMVMGVLVLSIFLISPSGMAARKKVRTKIGKDKRHELWKNKKWTTSHKKYHWRMVTTWTPGLLFYDYAVHFADSVRAASGGRLDITVYPAGAIVPAMETFSAVSKGVVEAGHDWSGYWKGKNEAFVAFASVPYGLDYEGYNIWLFARGGMKMWNKLYAPYNLVVFPGGNGGQEMGLFSNKKATKMEDFKGMRVRTVGWYMDILTRLGVSVSPLPGGEVYLALDRGVVDAAEFSTPAIDYPMGFQEITKYVIEPGVHQPAVQCEIIINKKAYESLPDDLKAIIQIAAMETQLWSEAWTENLNAKAIKLFQKDGIKFVRMDDKTIVEFAKTAFKYMDELAAKYPDVKKVLDSQEQFKRDFAPWREMRSGVTPWPREMFLKGKIYQ